MKELDELKAMVIEEIIKSKALVFGEIKLKSGRASPYFLNIAKMFNSHGLDLLGLAYAKAIRSFIGLEEFDGLFGPSYKGIPLAVATSIKLRQLYGIDKYVLYDRKELKGYGVKGDELIIGPIERGSRMLIIDDVLTTGSTKIQVKRTLEGLGLKVVGVVVLLDRNEIENGEAASKVIEREGLMFKAILDATELFHILWSKRKSLKISEEVFHKVKEYYDEYGAKKLLLSVEHS